MVPHMVPHRVSHRVSLTTQSVVCYKVCSQLLITLCAVINHVRVPNSQPILQSSLDFDPSGYLIIET